MSSTQLDRRVFKSLNRANFCSIEIAVVSYETDAAVQEAKRGPLEKETLPFYLEKLEEIAKENNGHFALKKVSLAGGWPEVQLTNKSSSF